MSCETHQLHSNNPNGNTNMLAADRLVFSEKALTKGCASKFKSFKQNSPKGQQQEKQCSSSFDLNSQQVCLREQLGEKIPRFYKSPTPLSVLMVSYTRTIILLAGY